MRHYWLFLWTYGSPRGGLLDLYGTYNSEAEAFNAISVADLSHRIRHKQYQIVDALTGTILHNNIN